MYPDLLEIAGFKLSFHGILITLGVIAGSVYAQREAKRRGLDPILLGDMIFWAVIWGVVGSRVVYVLTSPGEFRGATIWQMIDMRAGGNAFHGGIIGGVLTLLYYQRRHGVSFYRYIDLFAPGAALGIVGGRIGNFMNGSDSVGRLTSWPIGFRWPEPGSPILGLVSPKNWSMFHDLCYSPQGTEITAMGGSSCLSGQLLRGPVHLTQIYGALIGLVLLVGSFYWLRSRRPGWVFWNFVLWYSLLRTTLEEPFRLNPLWWPVYLNEGPNAPGVGLFTATQLFSVPLILVAAYMLWRIARSPVPAAEPARPPGRPAARAAS